MENLTFNFFCILVFGEKAKVSLHYFLARLIADKIDAI